MTPILSTGSYAITVSPEADQRRAVLLKGAATITEVVDAPGQEVAVLMLKDLKLHLKEVEEARKLVKAPILEAGKRVDKLAQEHTMALEGQSLRLGRLIAGFQEQERLRVAQEERDRAEAIAKATAEEEAKLKLASAVAGSIQSEADLEKAIQAEAEAKEAVAQTEAIIRAPLPEVSREAGMRVRGKLCWEVTDLHALYKARPDLVRLEPNAREINATCTKFSQIDGIRFWEETAVSVRTTA